MKIILVSPNLLRISFGNNFFDLNMVRTLENNNFLVRTKLGFQSLYSCTAAETETDLRLSSFTKKHISGLKQKK